MGPGQTGSHAPQSKYDEVVKQRVLAGIVGALVATAVASAPAAGSVRPAPTLRLMSRNPVTVAGAHFPARSSVQVTLITSRGRTRRVRTSAQGAFTVTFATAIDRCSGWLLTARQPGRALVVLHVAVPQCAVARPT